ncbi:MAG: thioredoxin domain-containing protein, partial [Proteobacteria bacterium]|nr:thioredoxin domain-containing protein [Pseudomonadota bacterium]
RCLRAGWQSMQHAPHAHASMLEALRLWLNPGATVILRGEEKKMREWQTTIERQPQLDRLVFAIPANQRDLPKSIEIRQPQGECVAYACREFTCSPPVVELQELLRTLENG